MSRRLDSRLRRVDDAIRRRLLSLPDAALERLAADLDECERELVRGLSDAALRALAEGRFDDLDPGVRRALGLIDS